MAALPVIRMFDRLSRRGVNWADFSPSQSCALRLSLSRNRGRPISRFAAAKTATTIVEITNERTIRSLGIPAAVTAVSSFDR